MSRCRLNVSVLWHSGRSADGAATLKACNARSVLDQGTTICKASDDRSARTGA